MFQFLSQQTIPWNNLLPDYLNLATIFIYKSHIILSCIFNLIFFILRMFWCTLIYKLALRLLFLQDIKIELYPYFNKLLLHFGNIFLNLNKLLDILIELLFINILFLFKDLILLFIKPQRLDFEPIKILNCSKLSGNQTFLLLNSI